MDEYGLAFGAAILALSGNPAERSLTRMTDQAPRRRRDPAQRAVAWLSVRRNALRAVAVAAVALFLLPLGLAWARAAVLDAKVTALRDQEGSREQLTRSAALYEVLQKNRWPMSKLLADVSGAMPVGVRVESVRMAPDQGLGLEASADSAEAVSAFQQNLNKTGIFQNVRISRADTAPGGAVAFEIDAAIVSPFLSAPPAHDFAAQPLAVRLYGEGASNTTWSADTDKAASSRPERPSRTDEAGESGGDDGGGLSAPSRPSGGDADEAPVPLTDEQIQAMERGPAMKEWARRKTFPTKALDQETKDRLASEVEKLKAQMDAKKP
jgi:Tfp pilus assembly protein PilN